MIPPALLIFSFLSPSVFLARPPPTADCGVVWRFVLFGFFVASAFPPLIFSRALFTQRTPVLSPPPLTALTVLRALRVSFTTDEVGGSPAHPHWGATFSSFLSLPHDGSSCPRGFPFPYVLFGPDYAPHPLLCCIPHTYSSGLTLQ